MSDTYTCANCRGTFEKCQTDEAAAVELSANFPGFVPDDCDVVCDDCYKQIMAWAETEAGGKALAETLVEGFTAEEGKP